MFLRISFIDIFTIPMGTQTTNDLIPFYQQCGKYIQTLTVGVNWRVAIYDKLQPEKEQNLSYNGPYNNCPKPPDKMSGGFGTTVQVARTNIIVLK